MSTGHGIQWLYLVSAVEISTSSKVIYSRVSLAKEPAVSRVSKLRQIPKMSSKLKRYGLSFLQSCCQISVVACSSSKTDCLQFLGLRPTFF